MKTQPNSTWLTWMSSSPLKRRRLSSTFVPLITRWFFCSKAATSPADIIWRCLMRDFFSICFGFSFPTHQPDQSWHFHHPSKLITELLASATVNSSTSDSCAPFACQSSVSSLPFAQHVPPSSKFPFHSNPKRRSWRHDCWSNRLLNLIKSKSFV